MKMKLRLKLKKLWVPSD